MPKEMQLKAIDTGSLRSLDMGRIRCLPQFAQLDESKLANVDLRLADGRRLDADPTQRREFEQLTKSRAARAQLCQLPPQHGSVHCVLKGDFALFDFIPAVLDIAGVPVTRLRIATLGFSKLNVEAMEKLLVAGAVGRVDVLCSHYFAAQDDDIYSQAQAMLGRFPGCSLTAMRTHAKLLLFDFGAVRYAVESSANLRSCHNVETATIFNSVRVHDFHAQWIDELCQQGLAAH